MDPTETTTTGAYGNPDDSIEAQISTIWMETLEVEAVGPADTFFDLGGESITGTLCAHRIQQMFGVSLPVSVLLDENVTVDALAAQVRAHLSTGAR